MQTALERIGPHLLRMTDGETGERSQWVLPTLDWLRANPDVEVARAIDYSDYSESAAYRLREGHRFDASHILTAYYSTFQRSYAGFRVLRDRYGYPDISFQVGLPAPVDLAVISFAFETAFAHPELEQAFMEATLREVEAIHAAAGQDVIFQIETVVAMVATASSPPEHQQAVAENMAGIITRLAREAPEGTRFGLHMCLGDFHHRALAELGSARPIVTLANEMAKQWPSDRPLEYIHAPFAAAEKPGSLDPSWYGPLADLDLPAHIRFVAGFVHEDLSVDELRDVQAMIESNVGHEVDVAATCGLGRRPSDDQAWDAINKTIALLAAAG
jgi:hypothetical protein